MSLSGPTHIGYAVTDIGAAAEWWAAVHGAGPFLLLPETPYDSVTRGGAEARLEHRLAFGQWGPIAVELQHATIAEPEELAELLRPGGTGLTHVSYLADDLEAEQARLEEHGMRELFAARSGPVRLAYHSAPQIGHAIELLQADPLLVDFYAELERASRGWDGSASLRDAQGNEIEESRAR